MDSISTRTWSEIHDLALVTRTNGKKVGTVEDFSFAPQTHSIPSLVITIGMFGHRVLISSSINTFSTLVPATPAWQLLYSLFGILFLTQGLIGLVFVSTPADALCSIGWLG